MNNSIVLKMGHNQPLTWQGEPLQPIDPYDLPISRELAGDLDSASIILDFNELTQQTEVPEPLTVLEINAMLSNFVNLLQQELGSGYNICCIPYE